MGASLLAVAKSIYLEFIHSSGWGGRDRLFEFDWEEERVGAS